MEKNELLIHKRGKELVILALVLHSHFTVSDDPTQGQNYLFYSNKISSKPDGDFIDVIHEKWFGDW